MVTTKQQGARAMSGSPFNWTVVWQDRGGGSDLKGSSSYRSREPALDAAREYHKKAQTARSSGEWRSSSFAKAALAGRDPHCHHDLSPQAPGPEAEAGRAGGSGDRAGQQAP